MIRASRACLGLVILLVAAFPPSAFARQEGTRTDTPDKVLERGKVWGVELSLGLSLYEGNTEQDIVDSRAKLFKRWGMTTGYLTGSSNLVKVGDVVSQETYQVSARVDRKLDEIWSVFVYTTHGMNTNLLIDYIGQVGAGPGAELKYLGMSHQLSVAAAYQYESYATGDSARVVRTAFRYLLQAPIAEDVVAGFDFFFAPTPRDFDDLRIAFFPYLETPILRERLSLTLNGGIEYDRQPLPGVKTTDRKLITALKLQLGE